MLFAYVVYSTIWKIKMHEWNEYGNADAFTLFPCNFLLHSFAVTIALQANWNCVKSDSFFFIIVAAANKLWVIMADTERGNNERMTHHRRLNIHCLWWLCVVCGINWRSILANIVCFYHSIEMFAPSRTRTRWRSSLLCTKYIVTIKIRKHRRRH